MGDSLLNIALTMIVKNESENLRECLEAAAPIVNQIIVVDTGSEDNTVDIAKSFEAEVFEFKWNDDFAEARNFALSKSGCDWNLILDADEVITNVTKEQLLEYARLKPSKVGRINIRSKFDDNGEIKYSNARVSRFAPRGVRFTGRIHEQLDLSYPRFDTEISVEHSGYFKKDKPERNINMLLKELEDYPEDSYYIYQIAKSMFGAKRYREADEYFEKGLGIMTLDMPYSKDFLVSYIYNCIAGNMIEKVLYIEDILKNNFSDSADLNFAYGIFCMELAKMNPQKYMDYIMKIESSYLRCLEIGESKDTITEGNGSYFAAYNLGVFYEVTGNKDFAIRYYEISAEYGYESAKNRLKIINV